MILEFNFIKNDHLNTHILPFSPKLCFINVSSAKDMIFPMIFMYFGFKTLNYLYDRERKVGLVKNSI